MSPPSADLRASFPRRGPGRGSRLAGAATVLGASLCGTALAEDPVTQASSLEATAAQQPLWEAGIGAVAAVVPDYPASNNYSTRVLPLPYFVYRGAFVRADDGGMRARAQVRSNIELELSGGGSLAAHTGGSGPRAGMPDLDYLAQLGPSLKITLASPSPGVSWRLDLPLRAVFSVGDHWGYQGAVFTPTIGLYEGSLFGSAWGGSVIVGPELATSQYQKYFYQVDPQYARPGRPAYDAGAGYIGSRLEFGVNRTVGSRLRIFGFCRVEDYSGARNEDSPLFQSHWGLTTFIGASWSFYKSDRTVPVPRMGP